MRSGLYGKLPAKRDFVAESLPPGFLAVWEPWLQAGLAASLADLGAEWNAVWMKAPIWRFRLGSALCGRTVVGALMPSIDGVGRCFPLTLATAPDDGEDLPPPAECAGDPWFEAIEDLLLSALDDDRVWDELLRDLAAAPSPATRPIETAHVTRDDGPIAARAESDHVGAAPAAGVAADLAETTFWWTIGGADLPAQALTLRGLPDRTVFARLLTGRVET